MFIREVDTGSKRQIKAFVKFLFKVNKDSKEWVPLITDDARHMLDRRHQSFYEKGDTVLFMVFTERHESAGRIAVLDNRRSKQQRYQHRLFIST